MTGPFAICNSWESIKLVQRLQKKKPGWMDGWMKYNINNVTETFNQAATFNQDRDKHFFVQK